MISEISTLTGIGRETIINTISEYRKTGHTSSPQRKRIRTTLFHKIDDMDRNGIRQTIHSFWLRRELPTIDKILTAVNENPSLPNFKRTTLFKVIKQLNFVYTKRKRCSVLTERNDPICWRQRYLYDIRKYRTEGRTVYYLDETWLNAGDCVEHVWVDTTITSNLDAFNKGLTTGSKNPTGKGKRLIVVHIGSNNGFLPGGLLCFESKKNSSDYHDEMNGDCFNEWFESVLPRLEPNSIIVLDNAPYHSVKAEKIPTSNSKKADILEWLISKGAIPERPMKRAELLQMVREIKSKYSSYIIDNMAKAAGHTVLRLPPYHCEFNPIELAWAMVKKYVKAKNTTYKLDDVRQLLNTAIERVTKENWENFIRHVIEEEEKIMKVDDIMDDIIDKLEPCILTVSNETSSDDSDL